MSKPFISPCSFLLSLEKIKLPEFALLIVDERFKDALPKAWAKVHPIYWVRGGEALKSVEVFPEHVQAIMKLLKNLPKSKLSVVALGGGSVGDFAGFLASVLFRGVPFYNIPSTWLAAVDSSHGGKTALNVGGAKNQIGSFYPARRVYLVEGLLKGQPQERAVEAYFEFYKMALLSRKPWAKAFLKEADPSRLWRYMRAAIAEKNRIVKQDPYDKKGRRQVLNLGHTLGHALEASHRLPHGIAVGFGLDFTLWWSERARYLPKALAETLRSKLRGQLPERTWNLNGVSPFFQSDKKGTSSNSVRFIFLKGLGQTLSVEVPMSKLNSELSRYVAL